MSVVDQERLATWLESLASPTLANDPFIRAADWAAKLVRSYPTPIQHRGDDVADLTDFLLARIAEDEVAARAATDPDRPGTHWHWVMDATDTPVADGHLQRAQDDGESVSLRTVEEYPTRNGWSLPHFVVQSGEVHGTGGEHIARWDPARVLAECEAKRRIIEAAWADHLQIEGEWGHGRGREELSRLNDYPEVVLLLALPYADHPDCDPAWRP